MRGVVLKLIVAVLAFYIGVVANRFSFHSRELPARIVEASLDPTGSPLTLRNKYHVLVAADGVTKDRYRFGCSGVQSATGAGYSRESTDYRSPERARLELQRALARAKTVIRREPFSPTGASQPRGEKAIAIFAKGSRYGAAALLWTDGSDFMTISSSSLNNILEYEGDFFQSGLYGP